MFAHILKDAAASSKAWLSRDRAKRRAEVLHPKKVTGLEQHYAKFDDPTATAKSILGKFTAAERGAVVLGTIKSSSAPTSKEINTYHSGPMKGEYTEERRKLHMKIIEDLLSEETIAAATPSGTDAPTYVILGGRGGSGKSAFTNGTLKEFDAKKFLVLDSDNIKKALAPPAEHWNAFSVHAESSDIFDAVTKVAMDMGLNILHDSTLRSDHANDTIKAMKDKGYRVEGHYMFLPRQEAASRAVSRFLGKGPNARGRLVPTDVVLDNTNNEKNFESMVPSFDKWSAYDNQGERGAKPTLISRSKA